MDAATDTSMRACFILSDSAGQKPADVYFEGEIGTDRLVTRALVRRRFGKAGIITIDLLLPHLHEGAGS
jgi:hypothetical protein